MKKLFAPFALFAIAGMLLSSCSNSSKLAFNKRHYRSGNFSDIAAKPHTILVPQITASPKSIKPEIAPIPITKSATYVAINAPTLATNKRQESSPVSSKPNYAQQQFHQALAVADGPVMRKNQTFSENTGSYGDSSDAAGAALSLLWIVIVVILILWLIGILAGGFGLGGLINLLLVLALILLILWLLRIW